MSSQYQQITKEKFDQFLADQNFAFEEVDLDGTKEYVYEVHFDRQNDGYVLRLWSSIDQRSDVSRDCGSDAIRLVMLYKNPDKPRDKYSPVFKEKKTLRTGGWDIRLNEKINDVVADLHEVKRCIVCDRVMVLRMAHESGNRFWGCTGWKPKNQGCSYTEDYDSEVDG